MPRSVAGCANNHPNSLSKVQDICKCDARTVYMAQDVNELVFLVFFACIGLIVSCKFVKEHPFRECQELISETFSLHI